MAQQRTRTRRITTLAVAILACGLALSALVGVYGQDVARRSLVTPGATEAIQLFADNIFTWMDGGKRVFLLQGQVWIEHGATRLRMPRAVVWVDVAGKATSDSYQVDVYGEGGVTVDDGSEKQTLGEALLRLATRGDVSGKAYQNAVQETSLANDALFQRARRAQETPSAPALGAKTAPALPPGQLPKELAAVPLPLAAPPLIPDAPPIPLTTNRSGIQQVQALQPAANVPGPVVVPVPGVPTPQPTPAPEKKSNPLLRPSGDANAPSRRFSIRPRTSQGISGRTLNSSNSPFVADGETAYVVPNGVIINVGNPGDPKGFIDIEADRMVLWTKGNPGQVFNQMQTPDGETSNSLEFYLTGNVEIRTQTTSSDGPQAETLRADEVYYDVGRNVAIALRSDLELRKPKLANPIHFQADEFFRLNASVYQTNQTQVFSTTLPSDPGLKIEIRQVTIEERETQKKTIFGQAFTQRSTGAPIENKEHYFKGRDMVVRLEGVPIFYFPYLSGRVEDPLGPLDGVSVGFNKPFGFHILTTWDIFDLMGVERPADTRWRLMVDYLSARGPALGTEFQTAGKNLFGIDNRYEAHLLAWGIYDQGHDVIGGDRGTNILVAPPNITEPVTHPNWRGRVLGQWNMQELPWGFSVQAQLGLLSDRNVLEQYYKNEFDADLNQETTLYVKQQVDRWAWTVLMEPRLRQWTTETEWLPKADGYLIGQKFFDVLTYHAHAGIGYAELRAAETVPPPYASTDSSTNTGRFHIWQDLSLPFQAGPFKIVPYGVLDLAYYSHDLTGDQQGRAYGGGGIRASIPFSRLYPGVESELFNVNGIYHKMVLSGNWLSADANSRLSTLPQLDRLNDDTSDQALRDIRPQQSIVNPQNATFLNSSLLFDPQYYALRRLVDNRIDSLDQIDVVQLDLRQRWQTKRGMPGNQHIIDWMTLDVGLSLFPRPSRDNFGKPVGIINYDWLWNIGDRTAFVSNGWFETIEDGPKVWNAGMIFNRPDASNFYLGYRQIDPLNSRAVVASVSYAFSAKYAGTASTVWDFGTKNQNYAIMLTRIGTDLRSSFGISYNSVLNSFGVLFEVVPNLMGNSRHNAFSPNVFGNALSQTNR